MMILTRHAMGALRQRSMAFDGSAIDKTALTVRAVIATANPIMRRDAKGQYAEILDPNGLVFDEATDVPLLTDHKQAATSTIGRAGGLEITDDEVLATLRFGTADDIQPIIQRVTDRTLRHVSVGYAVEKWRESVQPRKPGSRFDMRTKTAIRWRILEVSVVPVPADTNATIKRSPQMDDVIEELSPVQVRAEIRKLCRAVGMPVESIDDLIDEDATIEDAKAAAFDYHQAKRSAPKVKITANNDDAVTARNRLTNGLAQRMGATIEAGAAIEHRSFVDLARDAAAASGMNIRTASTDEILQRAMGTSDFPIVVGNAVNKTLMEVYLAAESPLKRLSRQRTLPNFKESTAIRLSGAGKLKPLSEHGEIQATSRGEAGEKLKLATYAARLDLTRQLMIDDDAGAFGDLVASLGRAAAATESEVMSSLILDNPALSDGTGVFRAANTSTAAALAESSLSAMRKAMRQRRDSDGTLLAIKPVALVVGPELETVAEKLLSVIQANRTDDVNVWAKLALYVDPFIEDGRYLLFGDVPTLQHAYLSGHAGPTVQRQESWDTLGTSWRVYEDFGAAWTDWRGAQYNAGA